MEIFQITISKLGIGFLAIACFAAPSYSKSADEISPGHLLALQHCASCHQLPKPDTLTKKSWDFCLTYMGFFLGIVDYSYMEGHTRDTMDTIKAREGFVRDANLLPAQPLISSEQWKTLREYYHSNAPEVAIPQKAKPKLIEDPTGFKVKSTQYRMQPALTSLVHIDEDNGLVLIHDGMTELLTILDRDGDWHDGHPAPGVALVDVEIREKELYLLNIGDLFASRIGDGIGELQSAKQLGGVYMGLKVLLKGLHRPCDFALTDMNHDGLEDALISNFGDYTGNLSLFLRNPANGEFQTTPQIISSQPGIVKSEPYDFNGDGHLDIAVLASAALENLSIFINKGDGTFTQHILVSSHSSFGYTGLELKDFNGDGLMDIITLAGDNGDSDPFNTLKRDQGIRIYLNQGNLQFEEAYFYPMYGVFGAEIEDFDLDGDLDIAAIAFHPDFSQTVPEYFVLLEQTEALTFAPKTHPATYTGRWMRMDAGDIDQDGDKDIILGAGYSPVGMRSDHAKLYETMLREGPPILWLENQARK